MGNNSTMTTKEINTLNKTWKHNTVEFTTNVLLK